MNQVGGCCGATVSVALFCGSVVVAGEIYQNLPVIKQKIGDILMQGADFVTDPNTITYSGASLLVILLWKNRKDYL